MSEIPFGPYKFHENYGIPGTAYFNRLRSTPWSVELQLILNSSTSIGFTRVSATEITTPSEDATNGHKYSANHAAEFLQEQGIKSVWLANAPKPPDTTIEGMRISGYDLQDAYLRLAGLLMVAMGKIKSSAPMGLISSNEHLHPRLIQLPITSFIGYRTGPNQMIRIFTPIQSPKDNLTLPDRS